MAIYDFRILLESIEGKQFSYYSGSFIDTSTELVLSASQVYNRITGSVSASYQNTTAFSGNDIKTSYIFKDNSYLSASLGGGTDTGFIVFTALDKEYDRLLRYKFMGSQKVCNVLGLPSEQWVYVDQIRLPADDESNYFEGNIKASNIHVDDTITFANTSTLNSDLPILIDTGSDRYIKFIDTRGVPKNALIMGYDVDTDSYEISGSSADFTFNIGGVDRLDSNLIDSATISGSTFVVSDRIRMVGTNVRIQDLDGDTSIKFNDSTANSKPFGNNNFGDDGIGFYSNHATSPKMVLSPNALSINTSNTPMDFRVDGNTNDNLFLVSGSAEKIGILTDNPQYTLDVNGDINATGTGSFGRIETTVVSSSIIYSSGSNIFGDAIDDTHTFNGHITASGNISASGEITAESFRLKDNEQFYFSTDNNEYIYGDGEILYLAVGGGIIQYVSEDGVQFTGHITASENISSSGTISTNTIEAPSGDITFQVGGANEFVMEENVFRPAGSSGAALGLSTKKWSELVVNHITASGNISASGYVYGDRLYVDAIVAATSPSTDKLRIGYDSNIDFLEYGKDINTSHYFWGSAITASGNISASGNLTVNQITASGNISASGNLFAGGVTNNESIFGKVSPAIGGTGSPSGSKITIGASNLASASLHLKSSNHSWELAVSKQAVGFSPGGLLFRRGASDTHVFDSAGNFGIGNVVPTKTLSVSGDISASGGFFVSSSGNVMVNSDNTGSMTTHLGAFSVNYGNATQLTGSLTADGSGYGEIVKFGGTTGLAAGAIVFLHTDGTWDTADATGGNAAAACSSSLLGVALGPNSDVDGVLLRGFVQGASVSDNAVGQKLYITTNANGRFTGATPGTSGNVVRVVGYSLTGDAEVYFNPSNDWIEIA